MEHRTCKKCGFEKELLNEFFYSSKGCFSYTCKDCVKQNQKLYYQEHKEEAKEYNIENRQNNREGLVAYSKQYYQDNKEELKRQQKENYNENREIILEQKKKYYEINKENILDKKSEYEKNNRPEINNRRRNRIKNDVTFMLRCLVSPKIRNALKKSGNNKNGNSVWKFLSYSPQELKDHLESLFEPWMTWDNYGSYDKRTWNDNDLTTWKWNIDHIIPQSDLLYTSMTNDNFQKCWALNNLRPYSSKQNVIDGNRRAA